MAEYSGTRDGFHYYLPENNRLSERELEVQSLIVQGMTNADIASKLGCSEQTVKNHVSAIIAKRKLRNRVQVAIAAFKESLLS